MHRVGDDGRRRSSAARHLAANIPGARLRRAARAPTTTRSRATRIRSSTRIERVPGRGRTARRSTSIAFSRPCCSPTSSARPRRPRGWRDRRAGEDLLASHHQRVRSLLAAVPRARGRRRRRRIPRGLRRTGARRPLRPSRSARTRARSGSRSASACTPARSSSTGRASRGIAVHIGARVAGKAGAGEVLVSSTVRDLVAGSGLAFESRGVARAQGRSGRVAHLRGFSARSWRGRLDPAHLRPSVR